MRLQSAKADVPYRIPHFQCALVVAGHHQPAIGTERQAQNRVVLGQNLRIARYGLGVPDLERAVIPGADN